MSDCFILVTFCDSESNKSSITCENAAYKFDQVDRDVTALVWKYDVLYYLLSVSTSWN